jgi:hypothetical protein
MPVSSEKRVVLPLADKPNTPITIEEVLAFVSLDYLWGTNAADRAVPHGLLPAGYGRVADRAQEV